jgi:hypothetical protein
MKKLLFIALIAIYAPKGYAQRYELSMSRQVTMNQKTHEVLDDQKHDVMIVVDLNLNIIILEDGNTSLLLDSNIKSAIIGKEKDNSLFFAYINESKNQIIYFYP